MISDSRHKACSLFCLFILFKKWECNLSTTHLHNDYTHEAMSCVLLSYVTCTRHLDVSLRFKLGSENTSCNRNRSFYIHVCVFEFRKVLFLALQTMHFLHRRAEMVINFWLDFLGKWNPEAEICSVSRTDQSLVLIVFLLLLLRQLIPHIQLFYS